MAVKTHVVVQNGKLLAETMREREVDKKKRSKAFRSFCNDLDNNED